MVRGNHKSDYEADHSPDHAAGLSRILYFCHPLTEGSGMTWTLPESMLSTPVPDPELRPGEAGDPNLEN